MFESKVLREYLAIRGGGSDVRLEKIAQSGAS
jgi:hypothetical protein